MVAPAMGGGLESTDLIADENGNLISNYIYGGGSSPFMRLDADGNAVYYLTDAMGTVIGLADGTGENAGTFIYDAFGEVLNGSGVAGDTGGDFRFQGQWLEADSGLYHFRARDYDAQTGLFLSRDAVDVVETEPESFNPYQFVYNNPLVYSDPTGMVTLNELQIRNVIQDILNQIKTQSVSELKSEARGIVGEILSSSIERLIGLNFNFFDRTIKAVNNNNGNSGNILEYLVKNAVCGVIQSAGYPVSSAFNSLWIEPRIQEDGTPKFDGLSCNGIPMNPLPPGTKFPKNLDLADFLISNYPPTDTQESIVSLQKSWLIGDFKLSVSKAGNDLTKGKKGQWKAMKNYATKRQYIPLVAYITFYQAKYGQRQIDKLKANALEQGVLLQIIPLTTIKR